MEKITGILNTYKSVSLKDIESINLVIGAWKTITEVVKMNSFNIIKSCIYDLTNYLKRLAFECMEHDLGYKAYEIMDLIENLAVSVDKEKFGWFANYVLGRIHTIGSKIIKKGLIDPSQPRTIVDRLYSVGDKAIKFGLNVHVCKATKLISDLSILAIESSPPYDSETISGISALKKIAKDAETEDIKQLVKDHLDNIIQKAKEKKLDSIAQEADRALQDLNKPPT